MSVNLPAVERTMQVLAEHSLPALPKPLPRHVVSELVKNSRRVQFCPFGQ
jgi:hypothetical protein